ncbi:MAG: hypothetical protein LBK29_02525 [Oscillospiraceae bacterium]|jgi:hypothetical protein|nr:hypothetical protein [Oscillospiraceae bacterium]
MKPTKEETATKSAREDTVVKPAKDQPNISQIRAILANKSLDGFNSEVRSLILKYGADRLSEIDPSNYPALLEDAKALGKERKEEKGEGEKGGETKGEKEGEKSNETKGEKEKEGGETK